MNFGLNELERGKIKRIKVKEKIVRKYIKEIKKECKETLSKGETIVDLEYIFLDTPSGWSFSPSERK